MDNSIFSFPYSHKMITRHKKTIIRENRKNSCLSDTSDEEYNPENEISYSSNSSSSSLNLIDDSIDETEIRILISDAKKIISNMEDNRINEDIEEEINNIEEEMTFTGLEILYSGENDTKEEVIEEKNNDNIELKISKKVSIKEKDIDKAYLNFLRKKKIQNETQVSYKYFKNLEDERKKTILNIEKNIRDINQGIIPIRFKILNLPVDVSVKAQIMRRFNSLEEMEESNSDYHKINEWLSTLLNVPFNTYYNLPINKDNNDIDIQDYLINVKNVLDTSIYGHDEAKFQIVQLITQWITNPKSKGKIIGLQGPMGNGKTTLVKNGICKAIDRPFATIPLGGASDASLLEGHSYTYEKI